MSLPKRETWLLDVNVLMAFEIPEHIDHAKIYRWFLERGSKAFATCAITQSGFVRLFSNPAIYRVRVTHERAITALSRLTERKEHSFWPMDIGYETAVAPLMSRISSHNQTTDAYLLGLAIHHKGKLATMDRGIVHLAGSEYAANLEFIS